MYSSFNMKSLFFPANKTEKFLEEVLIIVEDEPRLNSKENFIKKQLKRKVPYLPNNVQNLGFFTARAGPRVRADHGRLYLL